MAKDTLEKKIKMVCWWALGLTILYFLLGAWLKSDGPNFDPGKTYELLKDTLTLTATFLAPVAAFVLFSDWRKQHVALAIEADSTHVYKVISELINKLYDLHYDIEAEDNYAGEVSRRISNLMLEVSNSIQSLEIINFQLESRGGDGQVFAKCAKELFNEITCINLELSRLCVCKTKIQNPEKYNDYINTTSAEYSQHIQAEYDGLNYQIARSYPKLNVLKVKLNALCNDLRIKI